MTIRSPPIARPKCAAAAVTPEMFCTARLTSVACVTIHSRDAPGGPSSCTVTFRSRKLGISDGLRKGTATATTMAQATAARMTGRVLALNLLNADW